MFSVQLNNHFIKLCVRKLMGSLVCCTMLKTTKVTKETKTENLEQPRLQRERIYLRRNTKQNIIYNIENNKIQQQAARGSINSIKASCLVREVSPVGSTVPIKFLNMQCRLIYENFLNTKQVEVQMQSRMSCLSDNETISFITGCDLTVTDKHGLLIHWASSWSL